MSQTLGHPISISYSWNSTLSRLKCGWLLCGCIWNENKTIWEVPQLKHSLLFVNHSSSMLTIKNLKSDDPTSWLQDHHAHSLVVTVVSWDRAGVIGNASRLGRLRDLSVVPWNRSIPFHTVHGTFQGWFFPWKWNKNSTEPTSKKDLECTAIIEVPDSNFPASGFNL